MKNNNKVDRFLLTNYDDINYSDLVIFNNIETLEEIEKIIIEVKDKLPGEYTNEDILEELDNRFEIKEIINLYHLPRIEY